MKLLQKIKCKLGYHEYRGLLDWELFEKPFWDKFIPLGYAQTIQIVNSLDRYENECIHCKKNRGRDETKGTNTDTRTAERLENLFDSESQILAIMKRKLNETKES